MKRLSQDAWVLIVILVIVLATGAALGISGAGAGRKLEILPRRTSYSTKPGGLRALHHVLSKSGFRVSRHLKPLAELRARGVLLMIAPETYVSRDDWEHLKTWVESGNGLVVQTSETEIPDLFAKPKTGAFTPACPSFLSYRVTSIESPELSFLRQLEWTFGESAPSALLPVAPAAKSRGSIGEPLPVTPAFSNPAGREAAGFARCGKGWVIVMASAWPISNDGIRSGDNLSMAINAADCMGLGRTGEVIFDEYHHGYGETPGIWSLLNLPARLGLAQLLLAFLLLIAAVAARFGRALYIRNPERGRSEYLSSMASLLRRGRAVSAVNIELERRFLDEVAQMLGLPPGLEADEVLRAIQMRIPVRAEDFRRIVAPSQASPDEVMSEHALLQLEKRRDKLRKELLNL